MNIKKKIKAKTSTKIKKLAFKAIKPFLPFIIIILVLVFAICTIVDAVFVQAVQSDISVMSEEEQNIRLKCIDKASYLNTCHNYINNELTQSLLDVDNRELDEEIQWAHLYSIMMFHNMINGEQINDSLLNNIANSFESTFIYEPMTIRTETTTIDNNGNENISISETTVYILVESDTIMGHYKYNYEEKNIKNNNVKTSAKVFVSRELIGEQYVRLKTYLRDILHINENDIETDTQIVIQAAYRIL